MTPSASPVDADRLLIGEGRKGSTLVTTQRGLDHVTRTILVIILVIFLLGGFSGRFGGYGYGFGHGGIGVIGIILIIVVVLGAHGAAVI